MQYGKQDEVHVKVELRQHGSETPWVGEIGRDEWHTDEPGKPKKAEKHPEGDSLIITLRNLQPQTYFTLVAITDNPDPPKVTPEGDTFALLAIEDYLWRRWFLRTAIAALALAIIFGLYRLARARHRSRAMIRTTVSYLILCFVSLPSSFVFAQTTASCELACEKLKLERDTASSFGAQYVSPQDIAGKKIILTIRTRRDLTGNLPAVDDELYLRDDTAQRELWRSDLKSSSNAEPAFELRADQLTPGLHVIQLWYADTQPPDAHFFADLCGFAFFGRNDCVYYREGKTFGSGVVHNGIRVVVRDTKVWVSKLSLPKNCKCP